MRLATLSFSLVILFAATVLAQEIIAPEECFESMKVAQATEFNSFRSGEIVAAPANLHILQEPMVGPEVTKMRTEKAGKKAVKKAMKKAAGKGGSKRKKRHRKISSSTSKKHLSRGKKTNSKKASF
ncbi:hypothetical protein F5H01DRAFT_415651 [Linnemannia elongata]|nr:hypothetical protein F5H01DRAFT_415651 [Linnemannia elongata]